MKISNCNDESSVVDIAGVGFGPSNIALAIAAHETTPQLKLKFFETKKDFGWHKNMLFPNATMQVSFLKDLVTFRDPCSSFSFLKYVHSQKRLADFANLSQFCPSREEFSNYLSWCAQQFKNQVTYGHQVTEIKPLPGQALLRVTSRDFEGNRHSLVTRSLVYAAGLRPSFPEGCQPGKRIMHCSQVIEGFGALSRDASFSVTVVGGGQSAAEVVEYLHDNFPRCQITAVVSAFGYMPADDTPFINQIFDSEWVDSFFEASEETKQEVLMRHSTTNYAAVDIDLISSLYKKVYRDKLLGEGRLRFKRLTRVTAAREEDGQAILLLHDKLAGKTSTMRSDYLVCATGYVPYEIDEILAPELAQRLQRDAQERPRFSRAYQLEFESSTIAPIYCVGMNQYSHGLTSTLLSNIAIRSGETLEDLKMRICANEAARVPSEMDHAAL